MEQWRSDFHKGRVLLSRHDTGRALKIFSRAFKLCPACDHGASSNILFYMGLSLKRLGCYSSALRLWISAQRIKKQKRVRKMIERYANGYGMLRQNSATADDRNAFFSVQLGRYLGKKCRSRFDTPAERDVVLELIHDYWKRIENMSILKDRSVEAKRDIFHKVKIPFPYLVMPKCLGDSILNVNFNIETKKNDVTRCFCGSGLPFSMCCGRTPAIEELTNGFF
jgi:hypothetical protein